MARITGNRTNPSGRGLRQNGIHRVFSLDQTELLTVRDCETAEQGGLSRGRH
ncbi:hypothetical protein VTK73DRAFT_3916 [Phialemonium thermophilum]|uniref:Uncharacterized protein n=1 Tax=Phialemonium thermophilum TaxID=223376 RepID=A0ABR3VF68_9PEZI